MLVFFGTKFGFVEVSFLDWNADSLKALLLVRIDGSILVYCRRIALLGIVRELLRASRVL